MANARLTVVTIPHFKIEILLSGVLHPQQAAPMRRAITAVRVRSAFCEGHRSGVQVERMSVDVPFGTVVDPLQFALVRQTCAIRIGPTGGDDVRTECFVDVAGGRVLFGCARRIIDAATAGNLEGGTLKFVKMEQRSTSRWRQRSAVRLAAPPDQPASDLRLDMTRASVSGDWHNTILGRGKRRARPHRWSVCGDECRDAARAR